MKKDPYLSGVLAVFVQGVSDAKQSNAPDPARYPGEFSGSYMTGFDLSHVQSLVKEFVMKTASDGYDDGLSKALMRGPTFPTQVDLEGAQGVKGKSDFQTVYANAYTAGLYEASAAPPGPIGPTGPGPGPTGPGPTGPGPTGPGPTGPADSDNTMLIVGSLGAVAATLGVGYALYRRGKLGPAGPGRPALATNPAKDINPGHVWLQGVGWAPGKPAGQLRVGDRLLWNQGFTSTVEKVEKISAQFVNVTERLDDGDKYDRRMKVDRMVAIAGASRNPAEAPMKFVVKLDNMDQDDAVVATVNARGAAAWAKNYQNIAGNRWESDGPDFAYAILSDYPGLVAELQKDGYELDLDEYSPPSTR
jgi:hypothetical protein